MHTQSNRAHIPHRKATTFFASGVKCAAAAVLAIALALTALWGIAYLVDVLRAGGEGAAAQSPGAAGENAGVAFYLSQLVGVSFFNHSGELRFAALPGLLLVGLSIALVTALLVRLTPGTRGRRVRLALLASIPYASIAGLGALLLPMQFTARGLTQGTAIQPSVVEASSFPSVGHCSSRGSAPSSVSTAGAGSATGCG